MVVLQLSNGGLSNCKHAIKNVLCHYCAYI